MGSLPWPPRPGRPGTAVLGVSGGLRPALCPEREQAPHPRLEPPWAPPHVGSAKTLSPCRGHRWPEEPCPLLPALLASRCGPSRLTDGGVGPGLSLSQPALLSGRRPQASDSDPGGDTGLGGPVLRRAAKIPVWSALQIQPGPCWHGCRNHRDRLGRRPEAARRLSPAGTDSPGGHTAPHPGWRGQRGRVCSPPPWAGRGWAGGTAPHPGRKGRGGAGPGRQGAQPSIRPGPAGMHLQLMESNSASTGGSHWLLRAFNPASLSSLSFMR